MKRISDRTVATLLVGVMLLSVVGPVMGASSWETSQDWNNGTFDSTKINSTSGSLELGYPDGIGGTDVLAYYRLDSTNAGVVDHSGKGNDGSINGSIETTEGVLNSEGYNFEDNPDDVNISNVVVNDTSLSISLWVKPEALGGDDDDDTFVKLHDGSGQEIQLRYRWQSAGTNDVDFRLWDNGNESGIVEQDNGAVLKNDTWNHVVGVYNDSNGNWKLYVNGTVNATSNTAVDIHFDNGTYNRLGNTVTTDRSFNGTMDEVVICACAWNESQVHSLYNGTGQSVYSGEHTSDWKSTGDVNRLIANVSESSPTNVKATIEVSNDRSSVDESRTIDLSSGVNVYNLTSLSNSSYVRVRTSMSTSSITSSPAARSYTVERGLIYVGVNTTVKPEGFVATYLGNRTGKASVTNMSFNPSGGEVNVNVTSYNQSAENITTFTIQKASGSVTISISGLNSSKNYTVYQDGEVWKSSLSATNGTLTFTKDENWSKHSFRVFSEEKTDEVQSGNSDGNDGLIGSRGACEQGEIRIPVLGWCIEILIVGVVAVVGFSLGYFAFRSRS